MTARYWQCAKCGNDSDLIHPNDDLSEVRACQYCSGKVYSTTPKQTVKAILLGAAVLVEKGWTQWRFAADEQGVVVSPESPRAVCWCAVGAIRRAGVNTTLVREAKDAFKELTHFPISTWNDHHKRTAAEVADALRKVAADFI